LILLQSRQDNPQAPHLRILRQDQLDLYLEDSHNPLESVAVPSDVLLQLLIVASVSSFGSACGGCILRFDFVLEYIEQLKNISGTLLVFS
jgi:hypothetical protein